MIKKTVFCLLIFIAVSAGAFSQTAQSVPRGNMSRAAFNETFYNMNNLSISRGYMRIDSGMVPSNVHQAVWRELDRFNFQPRHCTSS